MEQTQLAEHFTMALSGRAKNVAPVLAERVPLTGAETLLDVGGGTGIYSFALLQKPAFWTAHFMPNQLVCPLFWEKPSDSASSRGME